MGCSDSRETTQLNQLRIQCEALIKENLSILHLLVYLLIDRNNQSEALLLLSLTKRTESFYSVITQYRNFWITEAKAGFKSSNNPKTIQVCVKEQEREKSRLNFSKETLIELIEILRPDWQDTNENHYKLKESLESDPILSQKISSLYGSFFTEEKKVLKKAALKYSENIGNMSVSVYKAVKSVTVNFYKIPENRIYYTHKIRHEKVDRKKKQKKNENKEMGKEKVEEKEKVEVEDKEDEEVKVSMSTKSSKESKQCDEFEKMRSIELIKYNSIEETMSDPIITRLHKQFSISEELSESSDNYDEETIARLSFTQK